MLQVRTDAALDRQDGYTFIELMIVSTMLIVLASAIMPLAKVTMQRMREAELRRALREKIMTVMRLIFTIARFGSSLAT